MESCTEALPGVITRGVTLPGVVTPVLTANLLARIHQFNLDYLELLTVETRCGASGPHCLPDRVLDALRKTTQATRHKVAASSFALYSLGFEDQEFWRTALRFDEPTIDGRYSTTQPTTAQSAFCELALVHAWHVALNQPIAARMIYAMPAPIIERLSHTRLWQLRRIALAQPGLLMPRWATNPCFWPEIVKFAASNDMRRLHAVQQLGHQLIAVDLQSSGEKRSAVRERQRNLLLQRLRQAQGSR